LHARCDSYADGPGPWVNNVVRGLTMSYLRSQVCVSVRRPTTPGVQILATRTMYGLSRHFHEPRMCTLCTRELILSMVRTCIFARLRPTQGACRLMWALERASQVVSAYVTSCSGMGDCCDRYQTCAGRNVSTMKKVECLGRPAVPGCGPIGILCVVDRRRLCLIYRSYRGKVVRLLQLVRNCALTTSIAAQQGCVHWNILI
jgi:hypothetical protein